MGSHLKDHKEEAIVFLEEQIQESDLFQTQLEWNLWIDFQKSQNQEVYDAGQSPKIKAYQNSKIIKISKRLMKD